MVPATHRPTNTIAKRMMVPSKRVSPGPNPNIRTVLAIRTSIANMTKATNKLAILSDCLTHSPPTNVSRPMSSEEDVERGLLLGYGVQRSVSSSWRIVQSCRSGFEQRNRRCRMNNRVLLLSVDCLTRNRPSTLSFHSSGTGCGWSSQNSGDCSYVLSPYSDDRPSSSCSIASLEA